MDRCANSESESEHQKDVEDSEKAKERWKEFIEEEIDNLKCNSVNFEGFDFSEEFTEVVKEVL